MVRHIKLLESMRRNPRGDWTIHDLKTVAERYGVVFRQPGTSHVTFRSPCGKKLTVPAHKPVKPVYIRLFVSFTDALTED